MSHLPRSDLHRPLLDLRLFGQQMHPMNQALQQMATRTVISRTLQQRARMLCLAHCKRQHTLSISLELPAGPIDPMLQGRSTLQHNRELAALQVH